MENNNAWACLILQNLSEIFRTPAHPMVYHHVPQLAILVQIATVDYSS